MLRLPNQKNRKGKKLRNQSKGEKMQIEYYNQEKFKKDMITISKEIIKKKWQIRNIYGIPRGGLIIATVLSHILNIPVITHERNINEDTLIVDDISDTGKTYIDKFEQHPKYAQLRFITIHKKPWTKAEPRICIKTTEKWVVYWWEKLYKETKRIKYKKQNKIK